MAEPRPNLRIRFERLVRVATLALPAVAILGAALLILGPGRSRPAIGAKVWGVPAEGAHHLALRIHVLEHFSGAFSSRAEQDVRVELFDTRTPPWNGRTDASGIADVRLESEAPLVGEVEIRVTSRRRLLARERVMLRPLRNRLAPREPIPGQRSGELELSLTLPRGAMSPPFSERVDVLVRDHRGEPAPHATLTAEGAGIEAVPKETRTDERGHASLKIAVHTINPELDLRAEVAASGEGSEPTLGTWTGRLPVKPGSIWVEPVESKKSPVTLRFSSPTPRDHAYVSLLSERGRELGRRVPLEKQGGFHRGTTQLELPESEWHAVTVTSDPYEQSAASVTWPLGTLEGQPELYPLDLLVDGMPTAERIEVARAWSARRSALIVLAIAALLEVALLMLRSRAAGRALEAHLATVAEDERSVDETPSVRAADLVAGGSSRALTILFAALVALAFAIVGALAYIE